VSVKKKELKEVIMRYVPIRRRGEYFPMVSVFDKFFDNFFEDDKADENVRTMAIDLVENEKDYQIKAVNISIDSNNLVIEANREEKHEEKKDSYYRCERYSGNYKRSIALTEQCDVKSINAEFKNGVLTITIPKAEPEPAKKIEIK
jgi:HSP20 family protein